MEEEKQDHITKMKKMEAEMEQVFAMKVREKQQKLKDSEADVRHFFCLQLHCVLYKACIVCYYTGTFVFHTTVAEAC